MRKLAVKKEKRNTQPQTQSLRTRSSFFLFSFFIFLLFVLLTAVNMHAQENQQETTRRTFFAAPVIETVLYGRKPPSIGLGFALGSEDKVSLGLKGIYAIPLAEEDFTTIEITIFFRVYTSATASGFFAQLTYGSSIFSGKSAVSLPAEGGLISIGITAGWRIPLGSRFFIEPYIRAGYPYYGGIGLSTGVTF